MNGASPSNRAASHLKLEELWRLFGPPSRVLRWCCSVHKSAPQTTKLREIYGKGDFVGLDFVGVRAEESLARSGYEVENFGKKQKGQYSHNSILEWTSAEVWAYLLWRGLPVNECYKKGNSRAGRLFRPLGSGGKADWFRRESYPEEVGKFVDLIRETVDDPKIDSYIANGGWVERKNGRDIAGNVRNHEETDEPGGIAIHVPRPKTDWREWIKTAGPEAENVHVEESLEGLVAHVPALLLKTVSGKRTRQASHKASACAQCGVCESNCRHGALSFKGGLHIENCLHCGQCHEIECGCVAFHSLDLPNLDGGKKASLNTFADHAPKGEWLRDFFGNLETFLVDNSLGKMQIAFFRRFLTDAGLVSGKSKKMVASDLSKTISSLGWENSLSWGLILANLVANNPQMRWHVDNLPVGSTHTGKEVEEMLQAADVAAKDARSIRKSFKRLVELPLGTRLNWGSYYEEGRGNATMGRRACRLSPDDWLAILYSPYLFAERSDNLMQFTLTRLLDDAIVSGGASPAKLFGLGREEMVSSLSGLGKAHPDFLSVTFTHDLEKISLREGKTSADVLALIG